MSGRVAFLDASALVKRYSTEAGTDRINDLFARVPGSDRACSVLGIAEVLSVLVRKKNDGRLSETHLNQAALKLSEEFLGDEAVLLSPIDSELALSSLDLIRQYNLNATDALLLLSVLRSRDALRAQGRDLFLASSDQRLLRAVRAEGITTFDPEADSLADLQRLLTPEASRS